MKRLIINADDFGYSRGVNYGIVDSHRAGILTSTTIMAGMPGFAHAVELAREVPTLGIGIHLTLTCGRPVLSGHKTLVDDTGAFPRLGFYEDPETEVSADEVRSEWTAQIERVLDAGIKPTHLDSHHHIHTYKDLWEVFVELAHAYRLPVRESAPIRPQVDLGDLGHPDCLIDPINPSGVDFSMPFDAYREGMLRGTVRQLDKAFETNECVELMAHPAYVDHLLFTSSSFNAHRAVEADLLQSAEARDAVEQLGDVELVSFKALS